MVSTKSDGQVVIEIVGDDSALSKSLNEASNKSERFGKELQRVNELLKLDPKNITLVEQKQKLLTDEVEATKSKLELLKQAEQEVQAQFEKGTVTEEHYRAVQREIIATEQALDRLTKEQSDFQIELDGSNASAKKFTASTEDMEKQMVTASASCSAFAVALIAVGAQAVQAAMEFDSAFAKTQTIMDQNAMSAKQMRAEIMGLSKSSGMSASDVSEAVYQAISGSVATEDATAFVEQANKLAVSGFTSLSNATDVLTTALNAYGLEADTVGGISNVLIQTQNLGKTSVDELASSMGKAISTGSAYGVNLENLSTAYVELTRGGIDTAEATTYISAMLNELGDSGSNVGSILQQQTGQSFGQLMAQGWSLGDVLQVLSDTVDGDAEALMGLWSSQEAGKASNAIMTQSVADFNAVCAQMKSEMAGTTGTTEKAYKTMTSTSEFIDQRFNNSINNLGIAFGDNLSPAVDGAKSLLTSVTEGLTSLVEKYPSVSAAATGLTAGIGALSVVLTLHTLKIKLATAETLKLNAAMLANPATWVTVGIAALVVGIGVYAAKAADATEETEKLSATSELQKQKIEEMNAEYEKVCETMGETSAEAQLLKEKIDAETESFEKNKKTAQELEDELQAAHDAYEEMTRRHEEQIEGIEDEYEGTLNLIERLNELTEAEYQSAAAKQEILSIVDILNQRIPELGLNYDALAGKLTMTPEEIIQAAENEHKYSMQEEKRNQLQEAIRKRIGTATEQSLEDVMNAAKTEWEAAKLLYDEAEATYEAKKTEVLGKKRYATTTEEAVAMRAAQDAKAAVAEAMYAAEAEYNTAQANYDNNEAEIVRLSNELGTAQEETGMLTGEMEAINSVANELTASLDALNTAYAEAYNAAYDSITGQYALWDDAAKVAAMSVADVTESMQEQTEYWSNYNANIDSLSERASEIEGLNEMIASFADGSEESVNMIAGMAVASDDDLRYMVQEWKNLQAQHKTTSGALAELTTGYTDKMEDLAKMSEEEIEKLNLSEEAKNAARDTILGYINGIEELTPEVATALASIRNTVRLALALDPISKPTESSAGNYDMLRSFNAYASGTYYADSGLALVGEAGPELMYLRGGERILNAEETKAILNTVYPVAPQMETVGIGAPSIAGRGSVQLRATIAVPVQVDGREFARATAEYIGEEMEFEVM